MTVTNPLFRPRIDDCCPNRLSPWVGSGMVGTRNELSTNRWQETRILPQSTLTNPITFIDFETYDTNTYCKIFLVSPPTPSRRETDTPDIPQPLLPPPTYCHSDLLGPILWDQPTPVSCSPKSFRIRVLRTIVPFTLPSMSDQGMILFVGIVDFV